MNHQLNNTLVLSLRMDSGHVAGERVQVPNFSRTSSNAVYIISVDSLRKIPGGLRAR
jgi:hypothetical protein